MKDKLLSKQLKCTLVKMLKTLKPNTKENRNYQRIKNDLLKYPYSKLVKTLKEVQNG